MMSNRIHGFLIALVVLIMDQVSKYWVTTQFLEVQKAASLEQWLFQKAGQAEFALMQLTNHLNIVMVWNPGISFGMLQNDNNIVSYGLTVTAILVAIGFLVWLWHDPRPVRALTVGLIVGGALGNVWDRLRFGAVIDFIDVHVAGYHWPAFNVADSAITVGVVVLLAETLFFSKNSSFGE